MSSTSFTIANVVTFGLILAIGVAVFKFDDAEKAMAFYGMYHQDPMNQLIHFFFIPCILWSGFIFAAHIPVPVLGNMMAKVLPSDYQLTYALVMLIIYNALYFNIDSFGATLYAPVLWAMYMSAVHMRRSDQVKAGGKSWYGTGSLMTFALGIHFLGWFMQVAFGHQYYEGNRPALLDSLGGALTVAPLFAFYEGVWYLGFKQDVQNHTLQLIAEYTKEACASGGVMRVCETLGV